MNERDLLPKVARVRRSKAAQRDAMLKAEEPTLAERIGWAEHALANATRSYAKVVNEAAECMATWGKDLQARYGAERITQNAGSAKAVEIAAWGINHIVSLQPNLRLDLLATYAAAIDEARATLAALQEAK
jgi:hypothetical protein